MLHEKPVQYNRPDGTGIGADAGSEDWTVTKRPRHLDHTSSSDSPPAQGDPQDPFFTAEDLEDFILTMDDELQITRLNKKKAFVFVNKFCFMDDESQRHVYERLLLYRLKAHKLLKGECVDKLDDETLKKGLPDFHRKDVAVHISQLHLDVDNYYRCLEKDEGGSAGWYFDPEFSKLKDLADYQRLVLKNHDDAEYLNWKDYRLNFSTYQMDKEYDKFCTEISVKLQWLKRYIGIKGTFDWSEKEIIGCRHALKIATTYPRLTDDLAVIAYGEHIWSLHNDYLFVEDWDIIFLEIWKLVTKKQWKFTRALMRVKKKKYVPQHDMAIRRSLIDGAIDLKLKFNFCVEGIPRGAEDGVAKERITRKILELPRKKTMQQYKLKKMQIAEEIGLHEDPSLPSLAKYVGDDYAGIIMVDEAGQPIEMAEPGSPMDHSL